MKEELKKIEAQNTIFEILDQSKNSVFVFESFGIDYRRSERRIDDVCDERNINAFEFLRELNLLIRLMNFNELKFENKIQ